MRWLRGRGSPADELTIFFATDIHGSLACFKKLLASLDFYRADVTILGGDMTGKMVVPIVSDGAGCRSRFAGQEVRVDAAGLPALETKLADAGYYPRRMEPDEVAAAESQPGLVDELFRECMIATLRAWNDLAEARFAGTDRCIYVSPGNDDPWHIDPVLAELSRFELLEDRVVTLGGRYEVISTGYSTPTPWNTHREVSEEELRRRIDDLVRRLEHVETAIFNFHDPPFNTGIDEGPDLDPKTLKARGGFGQASTVPVGSRAVRQAIEEYQPLLGLHGHIHESRGTARLGRTLCVNPGSEYGDRVLRGCLVRLEDGAVRTFQLTSG